MFMKSLCLVALALTFASHAQAAVKSLTCKTPTMVEGWKGRETKDYVSFTATAASNTRLTNATISGAYESDQRDITADKKYKPQAPAYQNYNRFSSLEDAWNWFKPLLPKDYVSRKEGFTGYIHMWGEQGFKGTLKLDCQLSDQTPAVAAKIVAQDEDNQKHIIALDKSGKPRVDGKGYPTIKDFDEQITWSSFCYELSDGNVDALRTLLTELVAAADGDGDSFAELIRISFARDLKGTVVVATKITDEGGEHLLNYTFTRCSP